MRSSNGNQIEKIKHTNKYKSEDDTFEGNLSKKEQKELKKKRKREQINKRNTI